MNARLPMWFAALWLPWAAGCTQGAGHEELASELRALRLQMRAQPSAPADPAALTAAMAPLREALDGLAASQRDLQGKQLALTQEMQRWSMLLVESTTGTHAEQGKALAARLLQLEAALQEQGERHRQVEALLQGALDKTSDRLDAFLQRLDTLPGTAVRPPQPVGGDGAAPAPTEPAKPAGSLDPPAGGTLGGARKAGVQGWLWIALAGAASAVSLLCWRAARPRPAPRAAEVGAAEPATQDLWEAAALLGEVVGRLRAVAEPGRPEVPVQEPAPVAAQVESGEIDDLFVLDDVGLDEGLDEPTTQPEPEPVVAATPASPAPLRLHQPPAPVTCRLQPRDLLAATQELLRILAADPRVLRRPEPKLTPRGATLEVSFVLLPGLPPGERSQLEQRLRDAVA